MEAVKQDYIFISYSRDDLSKIRPAVEEMKNSGYNVWNDTKILPGEDWTDHIASHIANCAVCVAFHSQTSRDSPHCREEIHYALKHGKTVISVYLEDVTLKEGLDMQLARFQSVKYAEPAQLLETLRQSPDFERCGANVLDMPKKQNGINMRMTLKKARQRIFFGWKFFFRKVFCPIFVIFLLVAILAVLVIYARRTPLWYLDKGGVLDIISLPFLKVEMTDYNYSTFSNFNPPPWATKTPFVECAVIRNGVTHIGASAFQDCSDMRFVFIPKSVTSIGDYAFSNCRTLKEINLPYGLKSLGRNAFSGCTGLKRIGISGSDIKRISDDTFSDCTGLKELDIPYGVTDIGSGAFSGCTGLESVFLPSSVTNIGFGAFSRCRRLEIVSFPSDGVYSISNYAFSDCSALKKIQFSEGIQAIESHAFTNCSNLEEITIPNSIHLIYPSAFSGCTNLKTVHIQLDSEKFC